MHHRSTSRSTRRGHGWRWDSSLKSWMDRHPRGMLAGGLSAWLFFAVLFVSRSPAGAFTHDFGGHLQFTQILYSDRRLPLPREGWETYQPPLYYLVNTLFSPRHLSHTFQIRLLSVLYGAFTLLLIIRLLSRHQVSPTTQLIVLSFIATTPSFLFMYSTYNNDSLATLISVALLAAAHDWILDKNRQAIIFFGILVAAGLYTKLTVVFMLAPLCAVLGILGLARKVPWERIAAIFGVVILGVALLKSLADPTQLPPHRTSHSDAGRFSRRQPGAFAQKRLANSADAAGSQSARNGTTLMRTSGSKAAARRTAIWLTFSRHPFSASTDLKDCRRPSPWAMIILHAILWIAAFMNAGKSAAGRVSVSFILLSAASVTYLIFRSPLRQLHGFSLYRRGLDADGASLCHAFNRRFSVDENIFSGKFFSRSDDQRDFFTRRVLAGSRGRREMEPSFISGPGQHAKSCDHPRSFEVQAKKRPTRFPVTAICFDPLAVCNLTAPQSFALFDQNALQR